MLDSLIEAAGDRSALTLLGISPADQMPIIGALANLTTLSGGCILVLQLTRVMKGDSKVLQRIAAAPHLAEAATAARHRGALAYWTGTLAALDHYRRAASLDPNHFWT